MTSLEVIALKGLPLIKAGDDLVQMIASILKQNSVEPRPQDVLVVAQKIVSTDPDEHVERIGYYVDLGFDHLVFHAPGPDQERFIRLYAEHVLPRLRRRVGAQVETPKSA